MRLLYRTAVHRYTYSATLLGAHVRNVFHHALHALIVLPFTWFRQKSLRGTFTVEVLVRITSFPFPRHHTFT